MKKILLLCFVIPFFFFASKQQISLLTPVKISGESLAIQIHDLVNKEREKMNLPPLMWNEKLALIAKIQSEDMAKNGYFDYINLKNEDPVKRAEKFGVTCAKNLGNEVVTGIAENIVKSTIYESVKTSKEAEKFVQKSSEDVAKSVVEGLLKTKENRENILDDNFESEGIGVFIDDNGNIYVTQDFCIGNFELKTESKMPIIDPLLLEKKIHFLVNAERDKRKLKKLEWNEKLAVIARKHSADMAKRNYFSHKSPEGTDPTSRAKESGFNCQKKYGNLIRSGIGENIFQNHIYKSVTYIGENAYYDYRTLDEIAETTVEGWMKSDGHRENILDSGYDSEGIGVVISNSGEIYTTQNFC